MDQESGPHCLSDPQNVRLLLRIQMQLQTGKMLQLRILVFFTPKQTGTGCKSLGTLTPERHSPKSPLPSYYMLHECRLLGRAFFAGLLAVPTTC